ncbi:hypothetical protein [Streptomyces sp. NPDC000880]
MNACLLCERNETDGCLCPGCTRATAERLDRMPKLYVALAAFLQPGGRASAQYGRTQAVDAPMPASEPAFNLRGPGGIVGILEDWRSAMQEDRGWSEPAVAHDIGRRIVTAARGLRLNIEWISSSWPMAGQFAEEIRDLERDVISIVDPRDPAARGTRIGTCPAVDVSGSICGAVLRYRSGEQAITCSWCLCSFPPSTWVSLKGLVDFDEARQEARTSLA